MKFSRQQRREWRARQAKAKDFRRYPYGPKYLGPIGAPELGEILLLTASGLEYIAGRNGAWRRRTPKIRGKARRKFEKRQRRLARESAT